MFRLCGINTFESIRPLLLCSHPFPSHFLLACLSGAPSSYVCNDCCPVCSHNIHLGGKLSSKVTLLLLFFFLKDGGKNICVSTDKASTSLMAVVPCLLFLPSFPPSLLPSFLPSFLHAFLFSPYMYTFPPASSSPAHSPAPHCCFLRLFSIISHPLPWPKHCNRIPRLQRVGRIWRYGHRKLSFAHFAYILLLTWSALRT